VGAIESHKKAYYVLVCGAQIPPFGPRKNYATFGSVLLHWLALNECIPGNQIFMLSVSSLKDIKDKINAIRTSATAPDILKAAVDKNLSFDSEDLTPSSLIKFFSGNPLVNGRIFRPEKCDTVNILFFDHGSEVGFHLGSFCWNELHLTKALGFIQHVNDILVEFHCCNSGWCYSRKVHFSLFSIF
jgi:hypothetical protein